MGLVKNDKDKEFVCRQCASYLDTHELIEGKCPDCNNDEDLFVNDLNED